MNILFVPAIAGKPWNGATLYSSSLGGSESAVAYTAAALAARKHQVTVLSHGDPMTIEGVRYVHVSNLQGAIDQTWDLVIISRWLEASTYPWKTSQLWVWLHDLPGQPQAIQAHRVLTLSEFQTTAWHLDPAKVTQIFNGVAPNWLTPPLPLDQRNHNKLVWLSNPDRGLALAARIFQEIRKRWPSLELHVYGRSSVYGWDASAEQPYLPLPELSENVVLHDSLPRTQLAGAIQDAWAVLYPTYWPETFCMATLEAQAQGTPVIATPVGALNETVVGGILTFDILNAVSQLRNANRWNKLSEMGRQYAEQHTWEALALKLESLWEGNVQ